MSRACRDFKKYKVRCTVCNRFHQPSKGLWDERFRCADCKKKHGSEDNNQKIIKKFVRGESCY